MTTLICGSLAFDTIMSFQGRFSEALLPGQLHKINVSFLVPEIRREFGGCAGNIAYNLKLLGGEPLIMATVGDDGAGYLERLASLGISGRCIRTIAGSYTAQCFITTDCASNQITAFHPGAMMQSQQNRVAEAGAVRIAIIAPDGRDAMLQHAHDCAAAGIASIFDPGQGLPMFDGEELKAFIEMATYVAVNDYEAELLMERTGMTLDQIADRVNALIVTRGELGADIFSAGRMLQIPSVPVAKVVDPTGCGDAFRAGVLHGLMKGMDWETTGRLASLMGAIKIAQQGGQNHAPALAEIEERFETAFGYRL
ncbi:MAG: carbohydrate kinase family protein [Burkholderiaceae bacterium]